MTKKIKFRLFDKEIKQIKKVYAIDWDGSGNIITSHAIDKNGGTQKYYFSPPGNKEYGDNPILMQFTGLKDKNDQDIYEGDIVKDQIGVGEIKWQDSWGGWVVPTKSDGYFYLHSYGNYQLNETEVIGNIYENPELLKGDK